MTGAHYNGMVEYLDAMVAKEKGLILFALTSDGDCEIQLSAHPFIHNNPPFFMVTATEFQENMAPVRYILARDTKYVRLSNVWSFFAGGALPEEFVNTRWLWQRWEEEQERLQSALSQSNFKPRGQ